MAIDILKCKCFVKLDLSYDQSLSLCILYLDHAAMPPMMNLLMLQICLSFFEVKNKQATWFTNKVEHLYWEHWYINLNVAQHPKGHSGKSHHSKIVVDPGGIVD